MKLSAAVVRCRFESMRKGKPTARRFCAWRLKLAELLEFVKEWRVLRITLNRPEKRNALNLELCTQLVEAFEKADNNHDVGAIVLNANGPAFCGGMDLKETID